MSGGTVSLGRGRVVDAGINTDVVKHIVVNGRQRQGTIFLIVLAGIHPKGSNDVRFVRDSELGAVNGAKPEAMPGFELRMGRIIRLHHLPVKVDKGGVGYLGKPLALKRCISNLIDNALKYGHCATLFVEDSDDFCIIRILDQGPGIPKDQLKTVFTPYYRLESSRNRDSGGTGLGLSIAQDIAESHGGNLVLYNTAEGGLEVVLTLPRTHKPQ